MPSLSGGQTPFKTGLPVETPLPIPIAFCPPQTVDFVAPDEEEEEEEEAYDEDPDCFVAVPTLPLPPLLPPPTLQLT